MPTITLPDGNTRSYDAPLTGLELAADISKGLAKKAIGVVINETLSDLSTTITTDAAVRIVTADDSDDDAQFLIRHSTAHVMAEAICELLPGTKLAYGPPVKDGFYYDIATHVP